MDPISDFLIRIKNASEAKKQNVSAPFSKIKLRIAEILKEKGFVGEITKKGKAEDPRYINVGLLYEEDGSPRVRDVKRISKPSRRLYEKSKSIKSYRSGYGMTVLSTSKGIMADIDAKKANLGGEVLFNIW